MDRPNVQSDNRATMKGTKKKKIFTFDICIVDKAHSVDSDYGDLLAGND